MWCTSRTQGLVLEVAFEGLQRSSRHKSGVAMRFPRINRLRWDKPPREADRLETLERMLRAEAAGTAIDPGRRVPHLLGTDYNAGQSAWETIDDQRYPGIAGGQ